MVSLDGYIETPPSYEGPNWAAAGDELLSHFLDAEGTVAAHVYGRRVDEQVVDWWPRVAEDESLPGSLVKYGRAWVETPKFVVSRTLTQVGPNTQLLRADPVQEVTNLLGSVGGDITLYGGQLASTFFAHGMVNEVHSYINPVCLGGGTPMFQGIEPVLRFRLLEVRPFDCGVVLLRYASNPCVLVPNRRLQRTPKRGKCRNRGGCPAPLKRYTLELTEDWMPISTPGCGQLSFDLNIMGCSVGPCRGPRWQGGARNETIDCIALHSVSDHRL